MLQARDYRRKHQAGAGVHCQKQEADTLKMCLYEDELTMTIFAILIPHFSISQTILNLINEIEGVVLKTWPEIA